MAIQTSFGIQSVIHQAQDKSTLMGFRYVKRTYQKPERMNEQSRQGTAAKVCKMVTRKRLAAINGSFLIKPSCRFSEEWVSWFCSQGPGSLHVPVVTLMGAVLLLLTAITIFASTLFHARCFTLSIRKSLSQILPHKALQRPRKS